MRAKKIYEDEEFKWIKNSKTHDDIIKSLEGKSLQDILRYALKYDLIWLVEYCLDNNVLNKNYSLQRVIWGKGSNDFTYMLKFPGTPVTISEEVKNLLSNYLNIIDVKL